MEVAADAACPTSPGNATTVAFSESGMSAPCQGQSGQLSRPQTALRRPLSQECFRKKMREKTASAVNEFVKARTVILIDEQTRVETKKKERMKFQSEQEKVQRDILRNIQEKVLDRPLLMDQDDHGKRLARSASCPQEQLKPMSPVEAKIENAISQHWYQTSDWAKEVNAMKERQNARPKLHEVSYVPKDNGDGENERPTYWQPTSPHDQKIRWAMSQEWYKNSAWAQTVADIQARQDQRMRLHEISYPPRNYEFDDYVIQTKPSAAQSLLNEPWFQGSQYHKELSGIMERVNTREKLHEVTYPCTRPPKVEHKNPLMENIAADLEKKVEARRADMTAAERTQRQKLKELIDKGRAQNKLYDLPRPQPMVENPHRNVLLETIEAHLAEKVKARRAEMAVAERAQRHKLKELCESGKAKSTLLALRKSRPASAF